MGYPDGYIPRSKDIILPPLPEANPAICVMVDIQRAYERGQATYDDYVEVAAEWMPQVPLGPAHGWLTTNMVTALRDRIARKMEAAR